MEGTELLIGKQSYHGPSHTLTKLYSVLEMSREMTK